MAAGIDKQTIEEVKTYDVRCMLDEIYRELKEERYRPRPVLRVMIPKSNG